MAARFCSECGERLKAGRFSSLPFRSFCAHCSPRFKRARLLLLAVGILCAMIGFVVGRYGTAPSEPFHLIGTPIESGATRVAPSSDAKAGRSSLEPQLPERAERLVISPSTVDEICGARTKSGKPCQRKVKGGGYCWQHRSQKPARTTQ